MATVKMNQLFNPNEFGMTRRQMVRSLVSGSILLPGILSQLLAQSARADEVNPLAPRAPHFPGKAKRVIFLYMTGGASHLDTFDPKEKLIRQHAENSTTNDKGPKYLAPLWDFKPGGKCGTEVSDLFPYLRECMDDICVIRSMHGDHNDHFQATLGGAYRGRPQPRGQVLGHG
ncbi:DUF1501 domain-containing protein [Pedosphaera parvula]